MAFIKGKILKIFSVVVILVAGFVVMNLLGSTDKHSNKRVVEPEKRTVNIENINFGKYKLQVEGNGLVVPQKTLNFVSEANGQVLFAKNDLKNGTKVNKDELIVQLDSREIENNLYSLRSDFMNSIASVIPDFKVESTEIYKKWYGYFRSIDIHKDIPELPEITNSQEKIKISSRNIFKKYYDVKNQEILLSKYTIKAPFEGFIESNGITKDSYVSRGQQLFTLKDAKNLEIAVPLSLEEASMLNFDKQPNVRIYSNNTKENFTGRIIRRETNLERNSQTLNVYVSFINDHLDPNFLPGSYVNVSIEGKELNNVALIPRHLVRDDFSVYTMNDGKLAEEKVEVIAYQEDRAVISESIPENTKIVTTLLQKPLIGMEIQTPEEAAVNNVEMPDSIDTTDLVKSN